MKLGPLLMLLLTYMTLSKAELPTIPTTNTSRETIILIYLKVSLIPADCVHIGGGGILAPVSSVGWTELLDFCFSSIKRPGEAVSESSIKGSNFERWVLACNPMRIFPKHRRRVTVHIVDDFLQKALKCFFCKSALKIEIEMITVFFFFIFTSKLMWRINLVSWSKDKKKRQIHIKNKQHWYCVMSYSILPSDVHTYSIKWVAVISEKQNTYVVLCMANAKDNSILLCLLQMS